eukprot:scaffold22592_cov129-Cylindrotheca_fusiformis.AAC.23
MIQNDEVAQILTQRLNNLTSIAPVPIAFHDYWIQTKRWKKDPMDRSELPTAIVVVFRVEWQVAGGCERARRTGQGLTTESCMKESQVLRFENKNRVPNKRPQLLQV